jgi:hypothetical protein
MDEQGAEDIDLAHTYLVETHAWTADRAQAKQRAALEAEGEETPEAIPADGEMALYVAHQPDHIATLLFMRELHSKSRNAHNAEPFRTAANVAAHPQVAANKEAHIPPQKIARIALAVVEDCGKCQEMREKARAQKVKEAKDEEQRKQRALSQKATADRLRRNDEMMAERAAEQQRQREEKERRRVRTPPLPPSDDEDAPRNFFDPAHSKWEKKRAREICCACEEGYLGGEKSHVYFCEVCSNAYHWRCTTWDKLQVNDKRKAWHCGDCKRKLNAGARVSAARGLNERPPSQELFPGEANPPAKGARNDASNNAGNITPSGSRPHPHGGGSGGGGGGDGNIGNVGLDGTGTPGTPSRLGGNRDIGIRVENYQQWQPLPSCHIAMTMTGLVRACGGSIQQPRQQGQNACMLAYAAGTDLRAVLSRQ